MRIAVVGAGISGLAAAWLLDRRHEVHLFEAQARLGGHANTVRLVRPDGSRLDVDTGFLVYNERTYPLLTRLFDELGVATQPSDMSWSLRCRRCELEYAGSARGIFADPRRVRDPAHLRLLADLLRFNRLGRRLLASGRLPATTLGRFVQDAGLSASFRDHYLLPMVAAIWSSGTQDVRDFDVGALLRFLDNHGLLGVRTHHSWRSVVGGSVNYVRRLAAPLGERVHVGAGIHSVARDTGGVHLRTARGATVGFDVVVLACHADQALGLLADPTPDEKELLGAWRYTDNDAWLHSDPDLLPHRPAARAAWNYLLEDCRDATPRAALTYDLGRLQRLGEDRDYLVTLNPARAPRAATVHRRLAYRHPSFVRDSVATQPRLSTLDGHRRTFFAGAYQRHAFHEDGLHAAVRVAARLGVRWPS